MHLVGPLSHRDLGAGADIYQDGEHARPRLLLESVQLGQELWRNAAQPVGDEDNVGSLEAASGLDDLLRFH